MTWKLLIKTLFPSKNLKDPPDYTVGVECVQYSE